MKHACLINLRAKYSVLALTILSILALSCEKKIPIIQKSDLLTLPTLTAKNFNTALKDSGKVQFILSAPIVEQYDKAIRWA